MGWPPSFCTAENSSVQSLNQAPGLNLSGAYIFTVSFLQSWGLRPGFKPDGLAALATGPDLGRSAPGQTKVIAWMIPKK